MKIEEIGNGELRASRPSFYFDPSNPQWPAEAALAITLPPTVLPERRRTFSEEVRVEIERQVAEARAELGRERDSVLGAEGARTVSPKAQSTTPESVRERNPTFAIGRNQGRQVWEAAVWALRRFRASYRRALKEWCSGLRRTAFPPGTWWMSVFHGACVTPVALVA